MDSESNDVVPVYAIPTYHWSEIASPRYKDLGIALLKGSVTITQSVHKRNETPKAAKAHPALVIYDVAFVRYKILELISPFLCEYLEHLSVEDRFDDPKIVVDILLDNLSPLLIQEMVNTISSGVFTYLESARACSEMGVELGFSPSTLVRSFKLAVEKAHIATEKEIQTCPETKIPAV